jgi:Family of unknown function (DUF5946)
VEGPGHRYVASSAGCWRTFGELQADELHRFGHPGAHRLLVDAYMAQHPGDGSDRRDRQSVFVHLIGLCAVLEHGWDRRRTTGLLRRAVQSFDDFPVLARASGPGQLTVLDMLDAVDLADFDRRARAWARSVWTSWSSEHDLVRAGLAIVLEPGHRTSGHRPLAR